MSDDRFRSTGEEGIDYQLPVQFLNTIIATPTFSDEIQMELMKVGNISITLLDPFVSKSNLISAIDLDYSHQSGRCTYMLRANVIFHVCSIWFWA